MRNDLDVVALIRALPPRQQPTRTEVRALAAAYGAMARQCIREGGNVDHLALDFNDAVTAYADTLGEEGGTLFLNMLTQEQDANTAAIERQIAAMEAENAQMEAEASRLEYEAAMSRIAAPAPPTDPLFKPLEQQSLGEQIIRGLIGAAIIIPLVAMCTQA